MNKKTYLDKLNQLLRRFGEIIDITGSLSGKWVLFEYYIEPKTGLEHVTEKNLMSREEYCIAEFLSDQTFHLHTNLKIAFFTNSGFTRWKRSSNYITLIDFKDPTKSMELQVAVKGPVLKLLKKDDRGRIVFFGLFRKAKEKIHS